jgi:hypothetical protein
LGTKRIMNPQNTDNNNAKPDTDATTSSVSESQSTEALRQPELTPNAETQINGSKDQGVASSGSNLRGTISLKSKLTALLAGLLVLLLGVALIFSGISEVRATKLRENWPTTQAKVLSVETKRSRSSSDSGSSTKYVPTLEYTIDGQGYEIKGDASYSDPSIGSIQQVSYNPDNAAEAYSRRTNSNIVIYTLMAAGGAFFCIVGIVVVVKGLKY